MDAHNELKAENCALQTLLAEAREKGHEWFYAYDQLNSENDRLKALLQEALMRMDQPAMDGHSLFKETTRKFLYELEKTK